MRESSYHLNSASNQITSDMDRSFLSDPGDSPNGLTFNARVPLRLNDIDAVRHSQVQATQSFSSGKTS